MINAQELVSESSRLISFPDVAIRVNQLISDPDSSAFQIAEVIEHDPALTAKLLRVANSAMLNVSGVEIADVKKAITRLGSRQITELLTGIDVARAFDNMPNQIVSVENYWRHCLHTAVIARDIANRYRVENAGSAFSAGLLHDIGQLIMFSKIPEESVESLHLCVDEYDGRETAEAERRILGFDHSDVGYELAQSWSLPKILQQCIRGHHQPGKLGEDVPALVWVVHIANSLAVLAELDSDDLGDAPEINEAAWATTGLTKELIPEIIATSRDSVEDILSAFTQ